MKGKHFTAVSLLTSIWSSKTKKSRTADAYNELRAAHTLLLRRRPTATSCITPTYRSVTACIH